MIPEKPINLGGVSIRTIDYAADGNAILGIRKSGKTYTATYMAERLMDAGVPIVAFDPIGVWRYLKVPGKGRGYEVVVAGENADLPLTTASAPEIVRAAMKENVSLVIDLYSMKLSKADWRNIVESCIRLLLYENKTCGLRHIFLEEAAEFCPQRIGPESGRVYAEIEKLARMGGNASLGYTLINQRSEEVNKAVLELCDTLILHRQKGRRSLENLSKWLDYAGSRQQSRDIIESLPMMPAGDCWVWLAGTDTPHRIHVPPKLSRHPDRENPEASVNAPARDVSSFVGKLRGAITIREEEAQTAKDLKKENSELRKQLETGAKAWRDDYEARLRQKDSRIRELANANNQLGVQLRRIGGELIALADRYGREGDIPVSGDGGAASHPKPHGASQREAPRAEHPPRERGRIAPAAGNLRPMERKFLTALAQHPDGLTKQQLLILTDYRSSGPVSKCFAQILRDGWVSQAPGQKLSITHEGLGVLGDYDPLPTGEELRRYMLQTDTIPLMERRMLGVLFDRYPSTVAKGDVLADLGYASSGPVSKAFAKLVKLNWATKQGNSLLRASDHFFE